MALRSAPLVAVALAAALLAEESAAQTPQEQYTKAVKDADAAMAKLEAKAQLMRLYTVNSTLQDRLVYKAIMKGVDESTALRLVKEGALEIYAEIKTVYRDPAIAAAKGIKTAGRDLESADKAAGVPENVYEPAYQKSEGLSERMEGQAEQLGEQALGDTKVLKHEVLHRIKVRFAEAAITPEPAAATTAKPAVNAKFAFTAETDDAPKERETLSAEKPAAGFNFGALVLLAFASAATAAAGTRAYLRRRYQDPFLYPMLG